MSQIAFYHRVMGCHTSSHMISGQENRNEVSREPSGSLLFTMGMIFPGGGQLVQKRWLAGTVYVVASVAGVIGFVAYGVRFFYSFYSEIPWDGMTPGFAVVWPYVLKMILSLALTILIWLISAIDLYISYSRRQRNVLLTRIQSRRLSPPPL